MLLPKYVPTEDSYIKIGNGHRKEERLFHAINISWIIKGGKEEFIRPERRIADLMKLNSHLWSPSSFMQVKLMYVNHKSFYYSVTLVIKFIL